VVHKTPHCDSGDHTHPATVTHTRDTRTTSGDRAERRDDGRLFDLTFTTHPLEAHDSSETKKPTHRSNFPAKGIALFHTGPTKVSTTKSLKSLRVTGLHGRVSFSHTFDPGLNIIHAKNGAGKTTLLHVIANALDAEFARFCFINFAEIEITSGSGFTLTISPNNASTTEERRVRVRSNGSPEEEIGLGSPPSEGLRQLIRDNLGGRPVYLPAFRMILESFSRRARLGRTTAYLDDSNPELKSIAEREYIEEHARAIEGNKGTPSRLNSTAVTRHEAADRAKITAAKTLQCREWFGNFVPVVRFPSLLDVEAKLLDELTLAQLTIGESDRKSLSDVFEKIVNIVVHSSDTGGSSKGSINQSLASLRDCLEKLENAKARIPEVYSRIASTLSDAKSLKANDEALVSSVLNVYEEAFSSRIKVQENALSVIRRFEESVNQFFRPDKELVLSRSEVRGDERGPVRWARMASFIQTGDGRRIELSQLSSGERHVLTLLFSVTHMSQLDGAVLIDEPELSLHVDWQRLVLAEVRKQSDDRQVIACTHAPEIAAEHLECFRGLETIPWYSSNPTDRFLPDADDV
jgi:predicted ATPase